MTNRMENILKELNIESSLEKRYNLGESSNNTTNATYNGCVFINIQPVATTFYPREVSKMKTFVILKPGEDGYIVAECPSMPGCISQGTTKEEALENVKEAIQLYREVADELSLNSQYEVCEVEV